MVFYGMSAADELRHEKKMPNEEGVELNRMGSSLAQAQSELWCLCSVAITIPAPFLFQSLAQLFISPTFLSL
jgi:hypothetical protein